jgi:hypothetical protein
MVGFQPFITPTSSDNGRRRLRSIQSQPEPRDEGPALVQRATVPKRTNDVDTGRDDNEPWPFRGDRCDGSFDALLARVTRIASARAV